ncbi:glutathione S-transferase [Polychytrium aggregatum]|uniref:glutathione S-transferase n=1 Tax=Polychytrium aggregatum TaxID=110093 RepID=UPI0022FDBE18|nr:glutathione S-transferase [Polychytrium aggregatum]KAI9209107.1 glutathione S-transferase [Polychytrium aggregatum]
MTLTKPTSLKITYFNIGGRAEATRLILFIAGIDFEDERINREQFLALKPTLPFGQVPILTVDGEHVIAQSRVIQRYAGAIAKLYPGESDPLASLVIDQIADTIEDLWLKYLPVFHESDAAKKRELNDKVIQQQYPALLAGFDKFLAKYGGKYAVGDKLTSADVFLYDYFNALTGPDAAFELIPKDLIDPYPNILRVVNLVREHPRVVEWEAKNAARQ